MPKYNIYNLKYTQRKNVVLHLQHAVDTLYLALEELQVMRALAYAVARGEQSDILQKLEDAKPFLEGKRTVDDIKRLYTQPFREEVVRHQIKHGISRTSEYYGLAKLTIKQWSKQFGQEIRRSKRKKDPWKKGRAKQKRQRKNAEARLPWAGMSDQEKAKYLIERKNRLAEEVYQYFPGGEKWREMLEKQGQETTKQQRSVGNALARRLGGHEEP